MMYPWAAFHLQLAYHEEFEQMKGQFTAVADDPETLRNLQNQKNASLVEHAWLLFATFFLFEFIAFLPPPAPIFRITLLYRYPKPTLNTPWKQVSIYLQGTH